MAKHKMPPVKEDISPNLVPMIDIFFLLLLFFMLGADMSVRESVDLALPVADQIKEEKETTEVSTTTVNIHHDRNLSCALFEGGRVCRQPDHWLWSIRGHDFTFETMKTELQIEANEDLEPDVNVGAGRRLSARKLIIRADRTAAYGDIQKVIELSGQVGMYKVEVAGAKPMPKPGT